MGDLSAHFSRSEFDCHDGGKANPSMKLVGCLENLRTIIGNRPITIVSGYRTASWNRRVGGAAHSRHLTNEAADIPSSLHVSVDQARRAGFTGIGYNRHRDVVHVDVRPGNTVVFVDDASY